MNASRRGRDLIETFDTLTPRLGREVVARKRQIWSQRAALALVAVFGVNLGVVAQEGSISLADAQRFFAEARAASAADHGQLWGREVFGPMLFADPGSRAVVANQADQEGKLSAKEGVFVGTLPNEVGIANTAFRWGGVQWTMVMWPLPRNRYARARLMMHECFHRIQEGLGIPAENPENGHLDGREGRVWLRLEWRALDEALIRKGQARRQAVEDALVFRALRRSLVPDAAKQEAALELNEGLSEYTGVKLSGWPAEVQLDRAAVRVEQEERSDNFSRSFAYASGPAYGLLLDESGAAWRSRLGPGADLGSLLREAMGIAIPDDLAGEANRRASRYDGAAVLADEDARWQRRVEVLAANRKRFAEGPILILPVGQAFNYSFDPNGAESLDELGTVYRPTQVSDVWGVLDAPEGALFARDAKGDVTSVRVPVPREMPSGPAVSGDGWTLKLAAGWKLKAGERAGDSTVVQEQ